MEQTGITHSPVPPNTATGHTNRRVGSGEKRISVGLLTDHLLKEGLLRRPFHLLTQQVPHAAERNKGCRSWRSILTIQIAVKTNLLIGKFVACIR